MTVSANRRVIADEQARHWRKRKLKFVSDVRTSNVDKHIVEGEAAVRLCNYTDVYYHEKITPDMPFMQGSATESEIERFGLKKGQVLLTKDSESWEDIAVPACVSETMPEVVCGYHLAVIEPVSGEVDGRFLSWLAQSPVLNDQFKLSAKGVTRFGLSQHALKNAVIDVPPLEYQLKVAAFLDRKTAEIDTLIAKKRRLLDRLAEKRTALITRAVTKGLNPDAPMKDSGIEWLGEIPAHWDVRSLRRVSSKVRTGSTPPSTGADYFCDEGIDWYTPGDISDDIALGRATKRLSADAVDDGVCRLFPSNSILIVGIGATLGKIAVATREFSANQQINVVLTIPIVDHRYLAYYLYSRRAELKMMSAASTLGIINQERTKQFPCPIPPLQEQREIAEYCRGKIAETADTEWKIDVAVERLKEYRSALITNAVTGQIKVA